ncbi:MAG: fumarylacetoacetate hydrolase, partial [Acetobacteraceae bacterium]|nr:fumarylacetoacetate hydrolase [Acetobacteraceae bacterium]
MAKLEEAVRPALPDQRGEGVFVGRVWRPDVDGPSIVVVRGADLLDISAAYPTMRELCEALDPANAVRHAEGERIGAVDDVLANTPPDTRDRSRPWLLAPIDLQAIKAAGVTFAVSMIERVIEERARGNPDAAAAIRKTVQSLVGNDLQRLKPGSDQAEALKQVLIREGAWSQYLEVGIGPDAEIFTKSQPLSSVGTGMDAGL